MATTMSITSLLILFIVMTRSIMLEGKCRDLPSLKRGELGFEIHYNTTKIQTVNGTFYKLDATVEWNAYNATGETDFESVSGYAVRMAMDTRENRDLSTWDCLENFPGYHYTPNTRFVFENLTYGFKYEFRIRTANITTRNTATLRLTEETYTPDCYESTGNATYCMMQPIQVASKPHDLVIDCTDIDLDSVENVTRVSALVTWLAPLQVNGNLTMFIVQRISNGRRNVIKPFIEVDQETWNQSLSYRFNTTVITDLEDGMVYRIKVIPLVDGETGDYVSSVPLNNETLDRPCNPKMESSVRGRGLRINPGLLAGLLCATVLLVVIIVGFVLLSRRPLSATEDAIFVRYPDDLSTTYSCSLKKDAYHVTTISNGPSGPMMIEVDPVFYKLEFDRTLLKIEEVLGSGQFGMVYKGFAYGIDGKEKYTPVAVKSLKENATRSMKEDFLDEIKLIVEIGSHPNILPILGCCTIEEPHYLIAELLQYGDLLHFLWKCREAKYGIEDPIYKLTATGQLQISIQVARGMEYLSTTLYYHGDLAARNVLVGEGLICKISDFGLADDIYQRGYKRLAPERKRPVKWVSLETNTMGKCSIQSDIWSFGIVLYEIYTLGGVPYPGMDGRQVIAKLQQGYRMDRPSMCPEEIYDLMRSCWFESPHNRPTFTILYNALDAMLSENVDYMTELEPDYSVYQFVPCVDTETETGGGSEKSGEDDSEKTGEGDNGLLPSISRELHARQGGKGCKFEAIAYIENPQISCDSAFSEESVLSGRPEELNLSWHLKEAMRNDSNGNTLSEPSQSPGIEFVSDSESVSSGEPDELNLSWHLKEAMRNDSSGNTFSKPSQSPGIEFVPIMDSDSESASSGEPDELNLWWRMEEAMRRDRNPLSKHLKYSKPPILEFVPVWDYDAVSASSSTVHSRKNSVITITDIT